MSILTTIYGLLYILVFLKTTFVQYEVQGWLDSRHSCVYLERYLKSGTGHVPPPQGLLDDGQVLHEENIQINKTIPTKLLKYS